MKKISVSICVYLWLISFCPVNAQVRPINDYGAIGLAQLLKRLNTTASVMMIGAHPDDEDSALLAYLARGENARTAYLSLTRGDGGQNIIGPELFESLGVIRTEELLQARRLDGAEQYFTRAFDYGFSKTLDEAKSKWDEKVILCDTVRAIRLFRPLVVISRFSGTPADGHGQHQYAGYISPLAVKAAGDPQQCTDTGEPWQVLKFYVEQGFSAGDTAQLKLNTGAYDPILGRSYFEIAMEGRSQHKSQGEGRLELHGDIFSGLNLVDSKVLKVEKETSIFNGIDTSLTGIPAAYNNANAAVSEYTKTQLTLAQKLSLQVAAEYNPNFPEKILPILVEAHETLNQLLGSFLAFSGPTERVQAQRDRMRNESGTTGAVFTQLEIFTRAIESAVGLKIDGLADTETVTPGSDFSVNVKVFRPKTEGVVVKKVEIQKLSGWAVENIEVSKDPGTGFQRREIPDFAANFKIRVPQNSALTQPYWLKESRDDGLFRWSAGFTQNLPFDHAVVMVDVLVSISGKDIYFSKPVQYRYADPARGEIRRDLNVVPKLSVNITPSLLVVQQSDKPQTKQITLRVSNNQTAVVGGTTDLTLPKGWSVKQGFGIFQTGKRGEISSFVYDLTIPANTKAGSYEIGASASLPEERFDKTLNTIAYPHIQTHRFYTKAETKVEVLDLMVAPVKVGYVMGSGDEVADSIRKMGLDVTMLEEKDLASGDLAKFGTIVVGIRAYETRPDLIANNQRLLEYVKNGGNLIVQYQRGNFGKGGLAPYSFDSEDKQKTTAGSIARVVDENAPVTILAPSHPALNLPNKIGSDDFKGWVQERNAYNLVTFDQKYIPILESHDAGEQPNKGGLVVATVGKGNWVYCSYSMFRQLPAGVPGAYRLFANLLSLPKP